jgi:hypothetical protein
MKGVAMKTDAIGNKRVEFRNMLVSIRGKVSVRRVVRLQV